MSAIIIENAPSTFVKKFWNKIDFHSILWLYWDGMDWCQYDEVIPDEADVKASKNYKTELSQNDAEKFLHTLISK